MKRMFKKIMTFALSAMLATQVFAVGASANAGELFIDTPVDKDGKTSVMVANFTEEAQKVRLFSAKREGGMLKEVSISDEVTLAAGSSAELVTELPVVGYEHFIWSDALVPYDKDAVALQPITLTAPAARDSAANHRTWAYSSFILEWNADETGIVDHYEIYEDGTYLDKTNQGYYIVYSDDINADSKSYTVKAVTAGGDYVESNDLEAGTLYMNEIDFSNMTVDAEAETVYDVTYYNLSQSNGSIDTSVYRYATTDDDKTVTKHWVDENTAGVEGKGMKMLVGEFGSSQYAVPTKVQDVNGIVQSAFKSYFTGYSSSAAHNNTLYLYLEDDYLTLNETDTAPHANVTFEWDYFDNNGAKLGSRYDRTGANSEYLGGGDKTGAGTNLWKTNSGNKTTYNAHSSYTSYAYDGITPNARIFTNHSYPSATTVAANPAGETKLAKIYLGGVRAWLTDRTKTLTSAQKIQTATGQFAGVETIDTTKGITPVWISGESQRRGVSDMATNPNAGACQTVGKGENRVGFNVADTYLGKYDKNVTIEFEYNNPNKNSSTTYTMTLTYQDKDGNSKTVTKDVVGGTGTIKFDLNDAGFSNGLINNTCDFTISPGATTDNLYIRNMKVHASNSVR